LLQDLVGREGGGKKGRRWGGGRRERGKEQHAKCQELLQI